MMHQCGDNGSNICSYYTHTVLSTNTSDLLEDFLGYKLLPVSVVCASVFGFDKLEMLSEKIILCIVFVAAWHRAQAASLPPLPARVGYDYEVVDEGLNPRTPSDLMVREGVPPPLCAGHCASPPAGPVCALNAAGTARTFATLCELEAVSCRESTYYAITSIGEC